MLIGIIFESIENLLDLLVNLPHVFFFIVAWSNNANLLQQPVPLIQMALSDKFSINFVYRN